MLKQLWKTALLALLAGGVMIGFASANPNGAFILKAKTVISKGQVLTEEMFETVEVNREEAWMIKAGTDIKGLIAKHEIAPNEYLSKQDLTSKKVITFEPADREFTVQTDLSRCVGGDLKEGDLADILFFDKSTFQAHPLFTAVILEVMNRTGHNIRDKEARDTVPATVKIKVTTEQAAELLEFEQKGLVAFAKVPEDVASKVMDQ
ncbi:SAF domain-containing protein [Effusibacillus lacus]|uniref:SAF domain-containing protein n=1 Tax=Effusibacillus lacus TaxID=1348429 RepID=A0A292YS08_9BACL|nr:SAF domain-containing protein [Effusibacillus lacus]TCS76920.1 SAF domain-containing protein [Effusibacillus lacus]GAX91250.1 hypothetical protein EFBL_2916 [Effusibacillus lacus]